MASVERYDRPGKPGKWYKARLSVGKDPATGKYSQPTVLIEAENLRAAKTEAAIQEKALRSKTTSGATFVDLVERWWEDNPKKNRPNTRSGYRSKLDIHILPRLGNVLLRDLSKRHFTQLKLDLAKPGNYSRSKTPRGLDPKTINQCLAICRSACRYGEEGLGWLEGNPAAVSRATQHKKPVVSATKADYQAVAEKIEDLDLQTMVVVSAMTGARPSEVCALKWEDISFKLNDDNEIVSGSVCIGHMVDVYGERWPTKTHSERDVPMDQDTMRWLAQWGATQMTRLERLTGERPKGMERDWYIWPSSTDMTKPSSVPKWSDRLRVVTKNSGVVGKVHFRALRHLAATLMVNNPEVSPATASRVLGHANTSMTLDVYAASIDDQAAAATGALSSELSFDSQEPWDDAGFEVAAKPKANPSTSKTRSD